ncbi:MAG: hypothetical protein QGI38_03530 [Candidatus Woesearchaeota archaeon]|jgi:hypothetical protein|nr:hypothetical protein [Candidatus Woesearchaeota archaeon]|tara:strand:+ start:1314 stop:4160 length:2847 start_codon:yes stop_codon:yes gene_type:complete
MKAKLITILCVILVVMVSVVNGQEVPKPKPDNSGFGQNGFDENGFNVGTGQILNGGTVPGGITAPITLPEGSSTITFAGIGTYDINGFASITIEADNTKVRFENGKLVSNNKQVTVDEGPTKTEIIIHKDGNIGIKGKAVYDNKAVENVEIKVLSKDVLIVSPNGDAKKFEFNGNTYHTENKDANIKFNPEKKETIVSKGITSVDVNKDYIGHLRLEKEIPVTIESFKDDNLKTIETFDLKGRFNFEYDEKSKTQKVFVPKRGKGQSVMTSSIYGMGSHPTYQDIHLCQNEEVSCGKNSIYIGRSKDGIINHLKIKAEKAGASYSFEKGNPFVDIREDNDKLIAMVSGARNGGYLEISKDDTLGDALTNVKMKNVMMLNGNVRIDADLKGSNDLKWSKVTKNLGSVPMAIEIMTWPSDSRIDPPVLVIDENNHFFNYGTKSWDNHKQKVEQLRDKYNIDFKNIPVNGEQYAVIEKGLENSGMTQDYIAGIGLKIRYSGTKNPTREPVVIGEDGVITIYADESLEKKFSILGNLKDNPALDFYADKLKKSILEFDKTEAIQKKQLQDNSQENKKTSESGSGSAAETVLDNFEKRIADLIKLEQEQGKLSSGDEGSPDLKISKRLALIKLDNQIKALNVKDEALIIRYNEIRDQYLNGDDIGQDRDAGSANLGNFQSHKHTDYVKKRITDLDYETDDVVDGFISNSEFSGNQLYYLEKKEVNGEVVYDLVHLNSGLKYVGREQITIDEYKKLRTKFSVHAPVPISSFEDFTSHKDTSYVKGRISELGYGTDKVVDGFISRGAYSGNQLYFLEKKDVEGKETYEMVHLNSYLEPVGRYQINRDEYEGLRTKYTSQTPIPPPSLESFKSHENTAYVKQTLSGSGYNTDDMVDGFISNSKDNANQLYFLEIKGTGDKQIYEMIHLNSYLEPVGRYRVDMVEYEKLRTKFTTRP